MSVQEEDREFDLVMWGATGFTGRLTALYLAQHRDISKLRWAIGGRSADKLAVIKAELVAKNADLTDLPVLIGDNNSQEDMDAVVSRTRVIISTVGPYEKYGLTVVDACVRFRTHYCDLTGESTWVRKVIDTYNASAVENGTRLVPSSGFDCVPSCLAVHMLADFVRTEFNCGLAQTTAVVSVKGGISGGTIESVMEMLELPSDRKKGLRSPYYLNPRGSPGAGDAAPQMVLWKNSDLGMWTSPWLMASVNGATVRRSNALLSNAYGENFRYTEVMGSRSFFKSLFMTILMWITIFTLMIPFTRRLARKWLPKSGSGPSSAAMANGYLNLQVVGVADNATHNKVYAQFTAPRDPGYSETAKYIAETGLCLALNADVLPAQGGVITPSVLGGHLLARLRQTDTGLTVGHLSNATGKGKQE